eukprot:m.329381 g.329381  ORF g.329381 m.329381 type:complete len:392 (+) comp16507_c1_seq4:1159-2334(+)
MKEKTGCGDRRMPKTRPGWHARVATLFAATLASDTIAGSQVNYTEYRNLNCFSGHGGINIDGSGGIAPAHTNITTQECIGLCDASSNESFCPWSCQCVVFKPADGGSGLGTCWRRSSCTPTACPTAEGFATYVRAAGSSPCPASPTARSILYVVFDDLRPDLSAYDVDFMKTPNIQKLADTGLTFTRAYCQQSVCSPSRNSFTTGRRPNSTKVWNFINHFRNAECNVRNELAAVGTVMPGGWNGVIKGWSQVASGGSAECCTRCSSAPGCAGWTYNRNNCTLYSSVSNWVSCPNGEPNETLATCVSGDRGTVPAWTPLPAHFRNNGYLTLGVGWVFVFPPIYCLRGPLSPPAAGQVCAVACHHGCCRPHCYCGDMVPPVCALPSVFIGWTS